MQKPIAAVEDLIDLGFPVYGVERATEFGQQRAGTTPVGENVRAQEPRGLRLRGGARPGLARYIDDQLPHETGGPTPGPTPIQLLNIIVDPTTAALLDQFDSEDDDALADPSNGARNPGRLIRRRGLTRRVLPRLSTPTAAKPEQKRPNKRPGQGSGRQPNRNKSVPGIAFVQANSFLFTTPNASVTLPFSSDVSVGDLLLVGVLTAQNTVSGALTVGVSDNLGNTYTQFADIEASTDLNRLTFFYAVSVNSGGCTVTATQSKNPASAGIAVLALLEYSGQKLTGSLDGTSVNAQGLFHSNPETTGVVTLTASKELLFGAFLESTGNTLTPDAGFTLRLGDAGGAGIHCMDNLSASASAAVTATAIITLFPTAAVGASFKRDTVIRRTRIQVVDDEIDTAQKQVNRLQALPFLTPMQEQQLAGFTLSLAQLKKLRQSL